MRAPNTLRRSLFLMVFLGVCAGFVAPAAAQSEAQKKEQAKEHFEKASRLYDVGKYAEAVEEYQKAYLNVEDPVFLFNMAQCYRLSDQPSEAVRFYRNYLRRAPNAPNRADVEKRIAEMEKLAEDKKKGGNAQVPPPVTNVPPPVTEPVKVAPPPPPPVTAPPPVVNNTPPPVVIPPPAPVDEGMSGKKKAGIGLAVGGGVLVAVGIVFGAVAGAKAKDLGKATVFDPAIESSGKQANALAVTFGLLGVAAGATGLILIVTDKPHETHAGGPGRLALFPLAGAGVTGAGARYSF